MKNSLFTVHFYCPMIIFILCLLTFLLTRISLWFQCAKPLRMRLCPTLSCSPSSSSINMCLFSSCGTKLTMIQTEEFPDWFQEPQAQLAQSQMKIFIKSRLNIFILWFLWCPVVGVVFVVVVRLVLPVVVFEAGLSTQRTHTHTRTPWQTHSERGNLIHAWPASCPPDLCYCSASPCCCCCRCCCIHLLECNEEEPNLKNNLNFCKTA